MYNQQTAPATAQLPTEQVVFDCLTTHAQQISMTSPIYGRAYDQISSGGWQNGVMAATMKNILELLNVRMYRYPGMRIETLAPECVRVIYSIVANVLAQKDTGWFNQLPYELRQASAIDIRMAEVVDQELLAYANATGHLPAANPGGKRGSVYSRIKGQPQSTGHIPATVTVEVPNDAPGVYRPSRGGGIHSPSASQSNAVKVIEQQAASAYVAGRPGSKQRPLAAPAKVVGPTSTPKEQTKMKQVYNPTTHSVKDNRIIEASSMDYKNHKPGHLVFPELSTSNKANGNTILTVAAGGLVFDPLSLKTKTEETKMPTMEDLAAQVIHYPIQVMASGYRHAELMIRTEVLSDDIALNDQLLSFEYRDFSPVNIYKSKEDAQLAIASGSLRKLEQVGTITELHALLTELNAGPTLDRRVANILNIRATEFVNEFMELGLGLVGWVTTDFCADWMDIVSALQNHYKNNIAALEDLLTSYTPMFLERTVRSVWIDMEPEIAKVVNRLAGIDSPTLRQRMVTLSDIHAVFDIPLQACQLGIQLDAKTTLLKPEAGCELFYDAIAQFLSRLVEDPAAYRTLTIVTADEYQIRVKPTELPVSATDVRRCIAVVDVRRN